MATNKERAITKAKQAKLEEDPDYVAPEKEKDTAKLVEAAIKNIKKDGGVSFVRPGQAANVLRPILPSGIFGVDHDMFGAGGAPRGRIVEVFGPPSGGKGTFTSQLMGNVQRLWPKDENALIDAECALDIPYANALGVDTDRLLVAQPEYGEQALQATLDIITTGGIRLCIVDSVAALVPKAELDGEMTDAHMGLQARMMGQALRKLTGIVSRTGTCLIFINQIRDTMNTGFGAKSDTPGGKALKFYSSVRFSIDRLQAYKEKDTVVGSVTKFSNKKNKTARPFGTSDANLMYSTQGFNHAAGFDGIMSLADYAIEHGVWKKDGANYMLVSTGEVVRGKATLRDYLRDDKTVKKITEEATLAAMGKTPEYIKVAMRG